jgi:hypothetical protein
VAGGHRFSGDGGPALEALLDNPSDVEVERDGSLIVLDQRNNRVRRITPDGIITTIAGTGNLGSRAMAGPL